MNQCYTCEKGKLEMCDYYRDHYWHRGGPVTDCPEYKEEDTLPLQVRWEEIIRGLDNGD